MLPEQHKNLGPRIFHIIRVVVFAALAALFWTAPSISKSSGHGSGFNAANLPAPALMEGVGGNSLEISTGSVLAQKYFNQGLNLLHCFWDFEAYRAFKEAARLDPDCAMAHWGISTALGQNASEMGEEKSAALAKAIELAHRASEREQFYIRALLHLSNRDREGYISEMEALVDRYPEDIQAQLFLARTLSASPSSYGPDGRPRPGKVYGQMILRNLLKSHPENAAVNHYWIHAVENGPYPGRALESAAKLPNLAPNSGHMVHMPGHIYYRLGDYQKAYESFIASMRVDSTYMADQNITPVNNWNFVHNLDYLIGGCAEDGRYSEGLRWAQLLQAIRLDSSRLKASGLGYILYGGYTAPARLQMRYGFWDRAAKSLELSLSKHPIQSDVAEGYLNGLRFYAEGMHAVMQQKVDDAVKSVASLEDILKHLMNPESRYGSDWYYGYGKKILEVGLMELRGLIMSSSGNYAEAVKLLEEAAVSEKNIGYWEPPHYTRPVLESLGHIHLSAGNWQEAIAAYERVLELRPRSGHALLGMIRAAALREDTRKVREIYADFMQVWRHADKNLSMIKDIRHLVESLNKG